jgi:membrane-bound serine protease (ClpP class)
MERDREIKSLNPPHRAALVGVFFRTVRSWYCRRRQGVRPLKLIAIALAFAAGAGAAPKILAADVDGMVHPVTVEIVSSAIERAKSQNASLLLLRLNTPGGLMDAMRQTIERVAASPIPVVMYVSPSGARAASAGFFLLEAGDIAAMAPGTNTGAAHPVAMGGEMDAVMKDKVENDAAAYMRSICERRGRNSALAETAVRQSKSFTEQEALQGHLIDLVASDERSLLAQLDGRTVTRFDGRTETLHTAGAEVVVYERSLRQRILSAVSDPNIAFVLLILGALAIYVEFSSPGLIAPGVIGAILVLVALSALAVMPINWLGAALIIAGLAMFVLEAKFASHGVLGAGGTAALALGAVMLIDSPFPEMRIHWGTALAVTLPFSAITLLLLSLVVRARRNKVETGSEGMIGEVGSAVTALEPDGKVFVHGEYWNAVSRSPAAAGAAVRVLAMEKLTLTVEPVSERSGG